MSEPSLPKGRCLASFWPLQQQLRDATGLGSDPLHVRCSLAESSPLEALKRRYRLHREHSTDCSARKYCSRSWNTKLEKTPSTRMPFSSTRLCFGPRTYAITVRPQSVADSHRLSCRPGRGGIYLRPAQ